MAKQLHADDLATVIKCVEHNDWILTSLTDVELDSSLRKSFLLTTNCS